MSSAPISGTLRSGRYAIIGELGSGSQAETLDAVDKLNGRAVAIKRFQVRGAKGWKDVELAEREARVLSTLSHPNLPVYIEHFEEDGALYLVMEKIEGETLASLRRRQATLTHADIARFFADADSVLSYLHSRVPPIIHRDIKPGNVILRRDGSFAFVDFGSVRDQLKPEGGSTVVGTFGYMAPEQFQGRALPGSDVYAVGATALSLVTGREPEDLPHRGLAHRRTRRSGQRRRAVARARVELDARSRPGQACRRACRPLARAGALRAARPATRLPSPRQPPPTLPRIGASCANKDASNVGTSATRGGAFETSSKSKSGKRPGARAARRAAFAASAPVTGSDRRSGFGPGGPVVLMVVVLALTVARLANWGLFRVFLPTLLFALSLFFGRPLRRAAWRCREVGVEGDRGLSQASDAVRGRLLGQAIDTSGEEIEDLEHDSAPRTRVAGSPLRVAVDPEPEVEPLRGADCRALNGASRADYSDLLLGSRFFFSSSGTTRATRFCTTSLTMRSRLFSSVDSASRPSGMRKPPMSARPPP